MKPQSILPICGVAGLVGTLSAVTANVIGSVLLSDHNWVKNTISALAQGEYGWIQDLGLHLWAIGILACAAGLFLLQEGDARWNAGCLLLALVGIDIMIIAVFDEHPGKHYFGANVHLWAVYALLALFCLSVFLLAFPLKAFHTTWRSFGIAIGASWLILGAIYWFVPTRWNGAYERFLGLILAAWIMAISALLMRRGNIPPS